jgi:hypothetical protein
MTANAYDAAPGTTLGYGDVADTPTYTDLANFIKAWNTIPAPMAEAFDITRTDQTTNGRQYGVGFDDPGKLVVTVGQDNAQLATALGLRRVLKAYRIAFASGALVEFNAILLGPTFTVADKDENSVQLTFQPSGDVTFSPPESVRAKAYRAQKLKANAKALAEKSAAAEKAAAEALAPSGAGARS